MSCPLQCQRQRDKNCGWNLIFRLSNCEATIQGASAWPRHIQWLWGSSGPFGTYCRSVWRVAYLLSDEQTQNVFRSKSSDNSLLLHSTRISAFHSKQVNRLKSILTSIKAFCGGLMNCEVWAIHFPSQNTNTASSRGYVDAPSVNLFFKLVLSFSWERSRTYLHPFLHRRDLTNFSYVQERRGLPDISNYISLR